MTDVPWIPKLSLDKVDSILCSPGTLHELETRLIDGRLQRVYKNLWPSMRDFWVWTAKEHAESTYIVYENERLTYGQAFDKSLRAAAMYRDTYGIQKGDRVGICSRNYPEYLIAFWACHLIGAVAVLVNAWLPQTTLKYCFTHTQCSLIILDSERAEVLRDSTGVLSKQHGVKGFVVFKALDKGGHPQEMLSWDTVLARSQNNLRVEDTTILPEDNATITFTSGTTGLPKGVLSTQRMFLTNIPNVLVAKGRAVLRRGEALPLPSNEIPRGVLVAVPLFHVTGITSQSMMASVLGMKIALMRRWSAPEAARLIREENLGVAGGVPSMVADLTESSASGFPLETLTFGGAPAPDTLSNRVKRAFPTTAMSQGYGLTETNSVAVSISAEDYLARPKCCGLATPVNDLLIVNGDVSVPAGVIGEVWIRGPNVMKEYWNDREATDKALTKDGWLKTGDLGFLDHEGFLYIRDRIKDVIIRGGENIDSISVENILFSMEGVAEVAVVGVPDERLGELVAAMVAIHPGFRDKVTEESLITFAKSRFAVPVMILIQETPLEHNAAGKVVKAQIRAITKEAWLKRGGREAKTKL